MGQMISCTRGTELAGKGNASGLSLESKVAVAVGVMAGMLGSLSLLPQAHAELVYESDIQSPAARTADRDALRTAMSASEKAQATLQSQPAQPARIVERPVERQYAVANPSVPTAPLQAPPAQYAQPTQYTQPAQYAQPGAAVSPVQVAPVAAYQQPLDTGSASMGAPAPAADSNPDLQSLSKSELMRRERVRDEVKNEDLLQERLEELRLRDENARTHQLLGQNAGLNPNGQNNENPAVNNVGLAPVVNGNAGMQEQVVVSPVTEHPGTVLNAPAPMAVTQPGYAQPAYQSTGYAQPYQGTYQSTYPGAAYGANQDSIGTSQAMSTSVTDYNKDKTSFYISPRGGVTSMKVNDYFDVRPHYSAGVALGVSASDNLSFETGYTYNEFGIALNSLSNPYYAAYPGYSYESYQLKQNIFEGGLRLHFLGPEARIRPFLGAGGAYSTSSVSFPQNAFTAYSAYYGQQGQDYSSSAFLGYISTGLDVRVAKSISVGAQFKYYSVLSSHENENMPYYAYTPGYVDPTKQYIGASLSQSGFYSILGDATFTF